MRTTDLRHKKTISNSLLLLQKSKIIWTECEEEEEEEKTEQIYLSPYFLGLKLKNLEKQLEMTFTFVSEAAFLTAVRVKNQVHHVTCNLLKEIEFYLLLHTIKIPLDPYYQS